MPKNQVAVTPVKDVGVPVEEAPVLRWSVREKNGGRISFDFSNIPVEQSIPEALPTTPDLTVSVQVSEDGVTFVDTTAAANGQVVEDEVLVAHHNPLRFDVDLRQGLDNFVQVIGFGGGRMQVQMKGEEKLQILLDGPDLSSVGP